jgi:hypothetical protein
VIGKESRKRRGGGEGVDSRRTKNKKINIREIEK